MALPSLAEAFPTALRDHVVSAVAFVPVAALSRSPDDIGPIVLNGEPLRIPARIYNPDVEIRAASESVERIILSCLYSRHDDGFVREAALREIIGNDEPWVAPFIVQLLGEYVVEIAQLIRDAFGSKRAGVLTFLEQNPAFLELTAQRAISHWDNHHRAQFPSRDDYPACQAIQILRGWLPTSSAA